MKKTLLILFFIGILTVISVSAAGNLTILNPPLPFANVTVILTGNFTLNNTGTVDLTNITFAKTQLTGARMNISSSVISFTPPLVSVLNTTELKLIDFTVFVGNAFAGNYSAIINATASNPSNFDSFQFNITVNPSPALTVASPTISNVPEGTSKGTSFTIANNGNTDLDVTLSVTDLTSVSDTIGSGNIALSKTNTSLLYGDSETLNVTVFVPSDQATGTYTGNITASYNGGSTTSTLTVSVVERSLAFTLRPSSFNLTGQLNSTPRGTFFVENTGTLPITDMDITLSGLAGFNVQFSEMNFNLSVGETKSIVVNAAIPVETTLQTYTGTITVTNGTVSHTLPFKINVKSNLEINDLDVEVDTETDNNIEGGDTISRDAKPESTIEFDVKVKNLFDSSIEDRISDIDNIIVTVTIFDIDDGDDMIEESDELDLDADESKRVTLTFDLPLELEEGTYDVELLVEGKDGNNIDHTEKMDIFLKVDKKSHKIIVNTYSFSPEIVTCENRTTLYFELMNIGSSDDDDVAYKIENSFLELKIIQLVPYELDSDFDNEDNTYDATHVINISDVGPGTYKIEIRVYYDFDKISTYQEIPLVVGECAREEPGPVVCGDGICEADETSESCPADCEEEFLNETGTVIVDVSEEGIKVTPTFIAIITAVVFIVLGGLILIIIKVNK